MPSFGARSQSVLNTCHPAIRKVLELAISRASDHLDFSVVSGHRGQQEQDDLYYQVPPATTLKYPESKHNHVPSQAVDIYPWPPAKSEEEAELRWWQLSGLILSCAEELDAPLTWGGYWTSFKDLPHYQLEV